MLKYVMCMQKKSDMTTTTFKDLPDIEPKYKIN